MIYLINMPFASITYPNLALGLFKSLLKNEKINCKVFDLNLFFARLIGYGSYQNIGRFKDGMDQIGEWLFTPYVWDELSDSSDEEFLDLCAAGLSTVSRVEDPKGLLKTIRNKVVPDFLRESLQMLKVHGEPQVVGFTVSFFQTLSSLALGRLIKEEYPKVKLVYGGANFHGEMGDELIRKIPWIDAVSTGEADDVIAKLFTALSNKEEPLGLQGILHKGKDGVIKSGAPYRPLSQKEFENLPDPDFSDFFKTAKQTGWNTSPEWQNNLHLFFESSRGCWWGQKCQCSFCGINGNSIKHRLKPGKQVYETISNYVKKYQFRRLQPTDNNMSPEYYQTLLPLLIQSPFKSKIRLLFEVKAIITREQMQTIADAGIVYIHPGIENFSTHILKLMKKGTRAIQNIYFLKLCREYNLIAFWNYLIRVPGERPDDYLQAKKLIPKIVHLQPPCRGRTSKLECVRFSSYFDEKKWVKSIRPKPWYSVLFPGGHIDLSRVAYFFDADWQETLEDSAYEGVNSTIKEWCRIWHEEVDLPELVIKNYDEDGSLKIQTSKCPKDNFDDMQCILII
jgi:ribosomal peptide maturation radical SAM protein 1